MKILTLLIFILISLSACYKESQVNLQFPSKKLVSIKPDTIPDNGSIKILLSKDSINNDETMLVFNHKSSRAYVFNEDALYFQGLGQVSLASISNDGRDLAINRLPYTPGMLISLDVHTRSSGPFYFNISYVNKIPANIQVYLIDRFLKDSVNLLNKNYNFNIAKTDTNSFGNKRFKIAFKVEPIQPGTTPH
jgi:hypothetical protein